MKNKDLTFLTKILKFFSEKFQIFWWNLRFNVCDQKLLLVTSYVNSYLDPTKAIILPPGTCRLKLFKTVWSGLVG